MNYNALDDPVVEGIYDFFASKNEYKFSNPSEAMENYVITFNHKVFVVNDQMEIVNSNIGLFDKEMESCLYKLSAKIQ